MCGWGRWKLINIRKLLNRDNRRFTEQERTVGLIEIDAIANVIGGWNISKWFGVECRGIKGINTVE